MTTTKILGKTTSSLVEQWYQHFGRTCCLHHKCSLLPTRWKRQVLNQHQYPPTKLHSIIQ